MSDESTTSGEQTAESEPDQPSRPAEPELLELPEAVRRRVLELAADALGSLTDAEVPTSLVRVRSFTPGRRATRGAVPLRNALERDDAFLARVAAVVRAKAPVLAEALEQGATPTGSDPVEVAAVARLLRTPGWADVVGSVVDTLRERQREQRGRRELDEVAGLRTEVERSRAALLSAEADARTGLRAVEEELAAVRRELRRHRSDADRARAQAKASQAQAESDRDQARADVAAADERTRRAEQELRSAQEGLAASRRAVREGRSLAGARARLLLDTVVDAAAGLRRELALPPADVRPADLVGAEEASDVAETVPLRGRDVDDPAMLDELLSLPQAHLVVDGYNVTKGAYGDLPLADQRRRLLTGLSHLAARTRAEITCCFDGAELDGRTVATPVRGVRVRFSEPGEIADDLIRRLVRAEPQGRVVVVASSDREVADAVRADGARAVASVALARLVGRG